MFIQQCAEIMFLRVQYRVRVHLFGMMWQIRMLQVQSILKGRISMQARFVIVLMIIGCVLVVAQIRAIQLAWVQTITIAKGKFLTLIRFFINL